VPHRIMSSFCRILPSRVESETCFTPRSTCARGKGLANEMELGMSQMAEFPPVSYQQWRNLVEQGLKGVSFEKKLVNTLLEKIAIQPIYGPEHVPTQPELHAAPGQAPYVRGRLAEPGKAWVMAQPVAHPLIAESQTLIREELAGGIHGLRLPITIPGRLQSSDRVPQAIVINSVAELQSLLQDVPLEQVQLFLEPGSAYLSIAGALFSVVHERKVDVAAWKAFLGADPLGTLAGKGQLSSSLEQAHADLVDLVGWTLGDFPQVRSVVVSTQPYHQAGCHVVQELAYAMATGVHYLRELTQGGISLEKACSQMYFEFQVGSDLFLEIAKLRAARWLWSKVVAACGGGEFAQQAVVMAQTSGRTMSQRDPWVNMLRTTVQTFAAVVGGAESVSIRSFDEALGGTSELGRRVARNVHHILYEESHVNRAFDPAGGSYYVENLTQSLAKAAWEHFQHIEAQGGMTKALLSGKITEEIQTTVHDRLRALATRKQAVVGISEFPNLKEQLPTVKHPAIEDVMAAQQAALSKCRNESEIKELLQPLLDFTSQSSAPGWHTRLIKTAYEAGGSCLAVRASWPTSEPAVCSHPLHPMRDAAVFEQLRDACDRYQQEHGERPRVFVANVGPLAQHNARTNFVRNFFEIAGIQVEAGDGYADLSEAQTAFHQHPSKVAVLVAADDVYPTLVPELTPALRKAGAEQVWLAGRAGPYQSVFEQAGVHDYVYLGCDVVQALGKCLKLWGISSAQESEQ
jgi:methylmalonyl-CoA mutase